MNDYAQYLGSEHPELFGKYAQVRPNPDEDGTLLAQFDDRDLRSATVPETRPGFVASPDTEGFDGLWWGYGWHALPIGDMPLVVRIPVRV